MQKYAVFSKALDAVGRSDPELPGKVLSGTFKISHKNLVALSKMPPEEIRRIGASSEDLQHPFTSYSDTRKEFVNIVTNINDTKKDAVFEVQIVVHDNFYRISSIIKGKKDGEDYTSEHFLTRVEKVEINKNDTYEKCLERLNTETTTMYNQDYIRELEKVEKL